MGGPELVPARVGCVMDSLPIEIVIALVASQCICFFAFMGASGIAYRYRLLAVYLYGAILATIFTEQASVPQLFVLPIMAVLRFVACLEVAHRQTEGFRYWSRLMASVMLLASAAAGVVWLGFGARDAFGMVIEIRRGMQVWSAGMFLALECCWLAVGGGWYRRADRIAGAFTLLALNHGTVSLLRTFGAGDWQELHGGSWLVEVACYLVLTWAILNVQKREPDPL